MSVSATSFGGLSLGNAGRLVLVIGPSGVGKDTLIDAVRDDVAQDSDFVFPVRTVTRAASQHEDNRAVSVEQFRREDAEGRFAVAWQAHGHFYGVGREIENDMAAGRTVVLNVSRTVIEPLRRDYVNVIVVQITAPAEVVAARLAARARASDGDLAQRRAREDKVGAVRADVVIENAGSIEAAAAQLIRVVRGN